ncbi:MAG TPA: peptide-methionine (S)-S-oxide reductase MsrA [Gemmatimonadaceae bacterium]|jgi:peptide-methionine (S)-S-oxide reductase|nr:peptide-methionine (S)-S-oxide reductase MsrA [Gemmatimonadaceae bacterium]
MLRSSYRGLAALGTGLAVALLFATRAVAGPTVTRELPDPSLDQPLSTAPGQQSIVFAGGCFWGVQAVFQHVKGVVSATSGYAGGTTGGKVSYDDVSSGNTGHAESVRVVYDTSKVSLGQLLKVFFSVVHDPTELNRQGPDVGTQYRSAVFYSNDAQRDVVKSYIAQLTAAKAFARPIVTEVAPLKAFHEAESYHQDYFNRHPDQPYIVINDRPKVEALRSQFAVLWQ